MKFGTAVKGYLLTCRTENKSPKTIFTIDWDLNIVAKWLLGLRLTEISEARDIDLTTFTTEKVRAFIEHEQSRGVSAHTVHQEYRVLRAFLRWCLREGHITDDPTLRIKPPRLPDLLPKALEPVQVTTLLKQLRKDHTPLGKRDELIVHTLIGTGVRASELVALNVSSVFPESSYLVVKQGKGRKDRIVPLEPMLNKELWKYIHGPGQERAGGHDEALFVGKTGRRLGLHALQVICRKRLRAIGVKGSVHIFRHTFASIFLRNGGNIEILRRVLGHQSPEVTIRYVSLLPDDLVRQQSKISPLESMIH